MVFAIRSRLRDITQLVCCVFDALRTIVEHLEPLLVRIFVLTSLLIVLIKILKIH